MSDLLLPAVQKSTGPDLDPYYNLVSLHLKGDVNTGRNYNAFSDASSNNFRLTNNGDVRGSSFSPYGTSWSNYFNGSSYLNGDGSSGLALSTGDFTIELWVFANSFTSQPQLISFNPASTNGAYPLIYINSSGGLVYYVNNSTAITGGSASTGVWHHVAVARSGTSTKMFLNGTQVGSTYSDTNNYLVGASRPTIGKAGYNDTSYLDGYISNLRVVKGVAVYTANFTVPTSPLTATQVASTNISAITGTSTSLLTCHANRFIDRDGAAGTLTVTRNGTVNISSFSPFLETDTTTGSGYFDGNADYLDVTSASFNPSGDFTIEFWFYGTDSATSTQGLVSTWASGLSPAQGILIWKTGANCEIQIGNASTGGTTIATFTWATYLNQWNHFALVRNSSNSCTVFLNGTRLAAPVTKSGSPGQTALTIGRAFPNSASSYFAGYLSNLRFVTGSAVYDPTQTSIPVPTTSLTATQSAGTNIAAIPEFVYATWSNGSLTLSTGSTNATASNIGKSSGKWYWEVTPTVLGGGNAASLRIGVCNTAGINADLGGSANGWCFLGDGRIFNNSVASTYGTAIGVNDVLNVALDIDAGKIWYGKNGTWMASGNPVTGANPSQTFTAGQTMYAAVASGIGTPTYVANFGATTFSGTPPTGFVGLRGPATQLLTLQDRGAYNTIGFQDESEYQHVITRNGNVAQGTFSPFSNAGWSGFFDGTGDSLTIPSGSSISGTGNFTVEFWIYPTTFASGYQVPYINETSSGFAVLLNSTGTLSYGRALVAVDGTTTGTVTFNQWNHVAFVRSGTGANQFICYINGSSAGSFTNSTSYSSGIVRLGTDAGGTSFPFLGYLSNVRNITIAVYTGNFTPPTSPLAATQSAGTNISAITGTQTSLLTLQDNRFIDRSTNGFTITRNGDTRITPFSPFKPVAYDPAVHGGSAYFDGSGDYLEMPYNPAFKYSASQDFCLEFWAYAPSALTASYVISQVTSNNWGIILGVGVVTSGRMGVTYGNGSTSATQSLDDTGAFPIGQWVHVVLCRTSGTIALFINGTRRSSASNTNAINLTADRGIRIGAHQDGAAAQFWSGYISGMRSIQGSNPYNATLTTLNVPSVPPTVVGNTSFLLNFTNGGVIDSTGKNVIETVGNAGVVTTTIKKYGSGSMFFDGTGDYVTSYNANALFRIGNIYTIELWFYTTTIAAGAAGLICLATGASTNSGINIYRSGSEIICNDGTTGGTGPSSGSSAITANTWAHLAVVSDGTTTKMYIDGVLKGTYSGTTASSAALTYATVGANGDKSGVLNGYIDDLRITKGYARYVTGTGANANQMVFNGTNTLALPTKALPDRGTASTLTSDLAAPSSVEALVVGGGGGGGAATIGGPGGGGGIVYDAAVAVSAGSSYPISVGIGGTGNGGNGANSVGFSYTADGGGAGGYWGTTTTRNAKNGGSGGAAGEYAGIGTPGTSTQNTYGGKGFGNSGGAGYASGSTIKTGGGGGAGGAGSAATSTAAGNGGAGKKYSITGIEVGYGGGGGGTDYNASNHGTATDGGGAGSPTGTAGTPNTGGGGGASHSGSGTSGGSGVVILAYPTSFRPLKASLGLVYTIDTVTRPGYRVYRFTSGSGSISW